MKKIVLDVWHRFFMQHKINEVHTKAIIKYCFTVQLKHDWRTNVHRKIKNILITDADWSTRIMSDR